MQNTYEWTRYAIKEYIIKNPKIRIEYNRKKITFVHIQISGP